MKKIIQNLLIATLLTTTGATALNRSACNKLCNAVWPSSENFCNSTYAADSQERWICSKQFVDGGLSICKQWCRNNCDSTKCEE